MTNPQALPGPHALASMERTIPDLVLAEALGYQRPSNIRTLIKRHAALLEAMGPLLQVAAMVSVGSGAQRSVTEYHLTKAQAAFLVAKAGTKRADSMTVHLAEVFAMVSDGQLVAADAIATAELEASRQREAERRRAIHVEEREARSDAFKILNSGRVRRRR